MKMTQVEQEVTGIKHLGAYSYCNGLQVDIAAFESFILI